MIALLLFAVAATAGVKNTHIANILEASRTYSGVYECAFGLDVHNHRTSTLNSTLGWSAASNKFDDHHWMMLDLGSVMKVVGTVVQGRAFRGSYKHQYVKKYNVSYSRDNETWIDVGQTFRGHEGNVEVHNRFPARVKARYIKFFPQEWNEYPTMRADVLVQYVQCTNSENQDADCTECEHQFKERCKVGHIHGTCWRKKCVPVSCHQLGSACDPCNKAENSVCHGADASHNGVCKSGMCAITTSDEGLCAVSGERSTTDISHCVLENAMGECMSGACVVTCRSASHRCRKGHLKDAWEREKCPHNACTDSVCCEVRSSESLNEVIIGSSSAPDTKSISFMTESKDSCAACLQSGGSWNAEAGACAKCDFFDPNCYTAAVGCPTTSPVTTAEQNTCKTCLQSGGSGDAQAGACTECGFLDPNCYTAAVGCPTTSPVTTTEGNTCKTCLQSGGSWDAQAGACTKCGFLDPNCYTAAVGCPTTSPVTTTEESTCKTCLQAGGSWDAQAGACAECDFLDPNCYTAAVGCPATSPVTTTEASTCKACLESGKVWDIEGMVCVSGCGEDDKHCNSALEGCSTLSPPFSMPGCSSFSRRGFCSKHYYCRWSGKRCRAKRYRM